MTQLSDDTSINTLFDNVRAAVSVAAAADAALDGAVTDVAVARQTSQDAQRDARTALRAFLDRLGVTPVLGPDEQAAWIRIFGETIVTTIDPDRLVETIREKTLEVAATALAAP